MTICLCLLKLLPISGLSGQMTYIMTLIFLLSKTCKWLHNLWLPGKSPENEHEQYLATSLLFVNCICCHRQVLRHFLEVMVALETLNHINFLHILLFFVCQKFLMILTLVSRTAVVLIFTFKLKLNVKVTCHLGTSRTILCFNHMIH